MLIIFYLTFVHIYIVFFGFKKRLTSCQIGELYKEKIKHLTVGLKINFRHPPKARLKGFFSIHSSNQQ